MKVEQFGERMDQFAADADADRTVMMVMMERMDGIQPDNHRIWQYLLSRDRYAGASPNRNGNSN